MTARPRKFWPAALLAAGVVGLSAGCVSDEAVFTQGRLEVLCEESLPVCATRASCMLDGDSYLRSTFPGGVRAIVRNDYDEDTAVVEILLTEALAPGTELQVELQSPNCGRVEEERLIDVDLIEEAGSDRKFIFELDFQGRGDHLLSVFSDMNASYLLSVTPE